MRDKFQKELEELNEEIIEMGKMIVYDIQNAVKALVTQDINLAKEAIQYDSSIDRQERNIEHLCLPGCALPQCPWPALQGRGWCRCLPLR